MPDYRPIPGQMDPGPMNLPMDDLSQMAREKASSLLSPYADQMGPGKIPSPGNGGEATIANPVPKPISPPSEGMEDKLYRAVHPDTFSQILAMIMQFVTGKPIPRQGGTPEGTLETPNKDLLVGEKGPEVFRPAVPGQIIPYGREPSPLGGVGPSSGRSLTYAGEEGLGPQIYHGLKSSLVSPYESPYEPGLPNFRYPGGEGGGREGGRGIPLQRGPGGGSWTPEGGYAPPAYAGPRPWKQGAIDLKKDEGGAYAIPEPGWKDYTPEGQPTGIRYKMGPEDVRGDELARGGVLAEAGRAEEKYGIPIPRKSYYDVHPEEKAAQEYYDMTRGPAPDSYEAGVERMKEMNLMDIVKNPNTTVEARKAAGEQLTALKQSRAERAATATKGAGDIYGKALEHGIGTPGAQEKLAHAEYLRKYPEMHMAGISEQGKTHLAGVMMQVEGHIKGAEIAANVKDPFMKEIGALLIQGQKSAEMYGLPFDPQKTLSSVLKVYKSLGAITDEQWAKIPQEYKEKQWTEQSLKADLKANGMKDKDIDAYIKRAKAAGKV